MQKLSDCAIFHARALCHIAEKYVGEKLLSIFFFLRFPLHFHMTNTFCRTIIVKVAKSRSCHFENYIITFACKKALCGELDYEGAKEARGE